MICFVIKFASRQDVYKRQPAALAVIPFYLCAYSCAGPIVTEDQLSILEAIPQYSEPVSYTHLDVYKRQAHNTAIRC